MKIKTGDKVIVLSGKDKGKTGKVISADPKNGKVIVEGVSVATKHQKAKKQGQAGGFMRIERRLQVRCRQEAARLPQVRHRNLRKEITYYDKNEEKVR